MMLSTSRRWAKVSEDELDALALRVTLDLVANHGDERAERNQIVQDAIEHLESVIDVVHFSGKVISMLCDTFDGLLAPSPELRLRLDILIHEARSQLG